MEMYSNTNNTLETAIDLPGKKRQLNYLKCRFCRQSKKKCEPVHRKWPGQKCNRCKDERLDCSENVRANGHTGRPPQPKTPDAPPTKASDEREALLVKRKRKPEVIVDELRGQIETGPGRHTSSDGGFQETVGGDRVDHERNSPNPDGRSHGTDGCKDYYDLSLRVAWLQRVKRYMQSLTAFGIDQTHGKYYHLPLLPGVTEWRYVRITAYLDDLVRELRAEEKSISDSIARCLSVSSSSHNGPLKFLHWCFTNLLLDLNCEHKKTESTLNRILSAETLSTLSDNPVDDRDIATALRIQEAILLKILDQGIAPNHLAGAQSALLRYCHIYASCKARLALLFPDGWQKRARVPAVHLLLSLSRSTSLLHLITEPDMAQKDFFDRSLFNLSLDLKLDGLEKFHAILKSSELDDLTKRKPLHISSLNGQIATSLALIDLAARTGQLDDQDWKGRTALHIASVKGHAALVLRLLSKGAEILAHDSRGKTPLHYAIAGGQVSTTAILAKKTPWQDWSTLVLPALQGGNVAVVSMIMDKVTDPLSADVKREALEIAVQTSNENLLNLFLQTTDPDIHFDRRCYGRAKETLLKFALKTGNTNIVNLLIGKYDVPVDSVDLLGFPYSLVEPGFEDVLTVLLDSGKFHPDSRNGMGDTALHSAARMGYDQTVRTFLDHGADIEIPDGQGRTPLFNAVKQNSPKIVRMLLEVGARVQIKDKADKSPLDLCMEDETPNMEIKALLKRYMNNGTPYHTFGPFER
ncbi:Ankyrin repeat-containing domain protein [Rhypophila decipiens]